MAPTFNVVGIVVADMARSLAFYRSLGLDVPESDDKSPHVEHVLPGGVKICWDTEDTIRSFDPSYTPPAGAGRIGLAFECASPAEVDSTHAALVAAGHARWAWSAYPAVAATDPSAIPRRARSTAPLSRRMRCSVFTPYP
jgi:catechol 2,3-dioxygenase-like lactoylglutathione lyase family enzyme